MFNQSGCVEMHIHFFFWHGLHGFFRFAQQLVTDKLVFTFTLIPQHYYKYNFLST